MPTQTVSSALIDMYYDDPGAPWKFTKWQQITGIKSGLFPEDDKDLPVTLTRLRSLHVKSFFTRHQAKGTQLAKIKFASATSKDDDNDPVPGRPIWRSFTTLIWRVSGIHAIITSILTEHFLHPVQIARASRSGLDALANLPNGKEYASQMVDAVALALFGLESYDKGGHHADMIIRNSTRTITVRTWMNAKIQTKRGIKRIGVLEAEAIQAFEVLEADNATKKKVKSVILKVSRWKILAHTLGLDEHMERVTVIDERLKEIMSDIADQIAEPSEKSIAAANRRNAAMLRSLLSEGDMQDVLHLYMEFFDNTTPADSVDLADQHATITAQFGRLNGKSTDLGIGIESALSPALLAHNLGYTSLLPLLFNNYYHIAGLRAWTPAHAHLFLPAAAAANPQMVPLSLHWHQLAGIHAIVRMNFTAKPSTQPPGCLIADEVGLGKTFLCAAVVAFLSDVVTQQTLLKHPDPAVRAVVRLPPILMDTPYLGIFDVLPKRMHLIIVPGTLLAQWTDALQILFKPHTFEILPYTSGKVARQNFWAPNGPFHTSIAGSNVIILATHSALAQDYGALYSWTRPAATDFECLPWDSQMKLPQYSSLVANTLFGHRYLSVTLDEAQSFRNVGVKHCGALSILDLGLLRMPMTATPLQTSTKDAASMGRLLGISHFLSQDALLEEKDDASLLRQVRRLEDPADPESQTDEYTDAQTKIVSRMQEHFENKILRRERESLDWKGEKLIDLPPCVSISVIIKPTPREMEIISEHADNVKESASSSNGVLQICSKDFYIGHRMCIAYARRDLTEKVPHFDTLEDWEPKKSTKFDVCARLCKHLLSRDDAPEIEVVDGEVLYPPLPPLQAGVAAEMATKILISQSYPSLGSLLRNVLNLHGVKHLHIDGTMSFDKRAKIVTQFKDDPEYRVLIMSSVGSIGLNLTVASVVIFVDQVWSAQDELQIRGRAHRQPQKKTVRCYHILADETADIVLAALARGKHHMMEAFLSCEKGKDMMAVMRGQPLPDFLDEEDEDDAEVIAPPPKKETVQKKKDKPKKTPISMSDNEGEGEANTSVQKKKNKKTEKTPISVSDNEGEGEANTSVQKKKKKQTKKTPISVSDNEGEGEANISVQKKKKKQTKKTPISVSDNEGEGEANISVQNKKTEKTPISVLDNEGEGEANTSVQKKKKKQTKKTPISVSDNEGEGEANISVQKKKKKQTKKTPISVSDNEGEGEANISVQKKKKKQTKKTPISVSDNEGVDANTSVKSRYRAEDVDFNQGASPSRGDDDLQHFRDRANTPDVDTDVDTSLGHDTSHNMTISDTNSADNDLNDSFALNNLHDNDFAMADSQPEVDPESPKTPPRDVKEARQRSIVPDTPELSRHSKRVRTEVLSCMVICPSPPPFEAAEDEPTSIQQRKAPPKLMYNEGLPSTAPAGLRGARRAPAVPSPLLSAPPRNTPTGRLQPQDISCPPVSSLSAPPRSTSTAVQEPRGARREPTISLPLVSVAKQSLAAPANSAPTPLVSRPKPTPTTTKSCSATTAPVLTPAERRSAFFAGNAAQSQDDVNMFHIPEAGTSMQPLGPPPTAAGSFPQQHVRTPSSQRHSTLSKSRSSSQLAIPGPSTQSNNPFARKSKKDK